MIKETPVPSHLIAENGSLGSISALAKYGRPATLVLFLVCADFLLFGFGSGVNLFLICHILGIAIIVQRANNVHLELLVGAWLFLLICLLPLLEAPSLFSIGIALFGLLSLSANCSGLATSTFYLTDVLHFLLKTPSSLVSDFKSAGGHIGNLRHGQVSRANLLVWTVPLVLGIVFVLLFAQANPLIQNLITLHDYSSFFAGLDVVRLVFWSFFAVVALVFVGRRLRPQSKFARNSTVGSKNSSLDLLIGHGSVLRSLIVFNLLFLVQTLSDATYLWGHQALPNGLTFAEYAHRGAYPLVVTAILAIVFILVAMRKNGPGEKSLLIKALIYVWVFQNMALVVSAVYRLQLYVAEYSLTGLRLAAAIWMGMIIVGLCLIVLRIVLNKNNAWLVKLNWLVVFVVFYGAAMTDFDYVISDFNVKNSRQISGVGQPLDVSYLSRFGAGALPAIELALQSNVQLTSQERSRLSESQYLLRDRVRQSCADWPCWHLRLDRHKEWVGDSFL